MRRPLVIAASVVCFALCFATVSYAGVRADGPSQRAVGADSERGLTALQRVLLDRLESMLRLSRAMRFLELPTPLDEPANGTNGIIDEPDPAGASDDDPKEREPDDAGETDNGPTENESGPVGIVPG